jgi:hypothetical protein
MINSCITEFGFPKALIPSDHLKEEFTKWYLSLIENYRAKLAIRENVEHDGVLRTLQDVLSFLITEEGVKELKKVHENYRGTLPLDVQKFYKMASDEGMIIYIKTWHANDFTIYFHDGLDHSWRLYEDGWVKAVD